METPKTELQSEAVRDYLEKLPHWLLRWGMLVVGLGVVGLASISWFIRYPVLVRAEFTLTSAQAPKPVVPKVDGRLEKLFVSEGQSVTAGQTLAYLESTANPIEILELDSQLIAYQSLVQREQLDALGRIPTKRYAHLGEIQEAYQTFRHQYVQVVTLLAGGFYRQKRTLLLTEIRDIDQLNGHLHSQHQLYARDVELADQEFKISQNLHAEKVIAALDLSREESKVLSKKLPLRTVESSLVGNLMQKTAKQRELIELDNAVIEQREAFKQALNTLLSAVETWKSRFVLTAPVSGEIQLPTVLQEKQAIRAGSELLYVGAATNRFLGEIRIPQANFGKVTLGQRVLIKFQGYPFEEFGAVVGAIASVSRVPTPDAQFFVATVRLPNGLRTDGGKTLAYTSGMKASAEIITEDLRLIERLFYQFRGLLR